MQKIELSLKHKNLIALLLGLFVGIFLYHYKPFHDFLTNLGGFGYLSAFLAGILYDSTVTVATGVSMMLILGESLNRWQVALIAGFGAVIGDLIVYKFVKDNVMEELAPLFETVEEDIGRKRIRAVKHLLHTKYFHWMLPLVGAILIGSPFPNELAWGVMGATKMKNYQVVLLSFVVNFTGISFLLSASSALKS